jgi:hypothetical protein
MDARETRHPADQALHAYGLGKLDNTIAESVNKHLASCPTCRSRVAELTSDTFLGRLRDAQGRPDSSAPVVSSLAGLSMMTDGSSSTAPPPASGLTPGLGDHPDYRPGRAWSTWGRQNAPGTRRPPSRQRVVLYGFGRLWPPVSCCSGWSRLWRPASSRSRLPMA